MNTPKNDEWTIARWRLQPRFPALHLDEPPVAVEQSPPLWKDLILASAVALVLWIAAAVILR